MDTLVTVLAVVGGLLGCVFVFLVEQSFSWRKAGKYDLVKQASKIETVLGFISLLAIFLAVLLSNL